MSSYLVFAQRKDVYLKLVNSSGLMLKCDATTKGFERQIYVLSNSSGGKNNSEITFTMNLCGASADLQKAFTNGDFLKNGEMKTMVMNNTSGTFGISAVIKMENIKVKNYSESGNVATVVLQSTRIGWMYYQQSNKGTWVLANKYSYDADTGGNWKDF